MDLSCPISAERINENVVRIIAFIVAVTAIFCVISTNYWAVLFLLFDFAARAFGNGKFSFLKVLAVNVSKVLKLKYVMVDLAPKKFAATLGFVFCLLITTMFLLNFDLIVLALTSIMILFALLESIFAICVGCYFYSFIQMIKEKL
ncbi:DUF4395 domain-containing protein [Pedobacter aquatilis]|uniref:DUF4395 domain-containing protein n=1 Tax=Pedobacter aquatilis TaxID=351343 RepID=UPI0025B33989|nr:DUF4395 domain-containing protein [Pedobacter aquatilis]MDN3586460.1 DUF4395 domain-containing protein [Pedobacter aquatilis]